MKKSSYLYELLDVQATSCSTFISEFKKKKKGSGMFRLSKLLGFGVKQIQARS